jgi:hypothetical protein
MYRVSPLHEAQISDGKTSIQPKLTIEQECFTFTSSMNSTVQARAPNYHL